MAGLSDRAPTFLSARSADVILSEIRPTKLNPEAWRSINVLLDEMLWLILSTARSFSTETIKSGLLKVLPTTLGKEALLEAEVELRAYWERTATSTPSHSYIDNVHEFPLQPAYELMRLKCEAYSTLNDSDEDTDAEDRWQAKVTSSSGFSPHNVPYISAAALYLTAIIEAVCEHILSNIGRVTARDSSRTTASLQDLYIALCEDESIYGLFKNMKVHEQIESQSKAFGRPRRSKSINRPSDHGRTSSHAMSASFSVSAGLDGGSIASSKNRVSSDSAASGTPNTTSAAQGPSGSRSSLEKSRAKKLFGRGSAEKDGSQGSLGHVDTSGIHKRTESILSNGKRSTTPFDDGGQHSPTATEVEFDELMRSGTTMKVSLTPDRLKSFEVYKQEKGQRGNKSVSRGASSGSKSPNDASMDTPVTPEVPSPAATNGHVAPGRASVHEPIAEDEETGGASSANQQRQRKKSRGPPPVAYEPAPTAPSTRSRSMSGSQSFSQGHQSNMGRKSSLGAIGYIAPPPGSAGTQTSAKSRAVVSKASNASRGGPLDRDNSLEGTSDDDLPLMKRKRAVGFQPKDARGGSGGTKELISFLNEGPPEPAMPPPGLPPVDGPRKQGRFKSMVSRLKRGGSTEKLTMLEQAAKNGVPPPPAFVPPPLSAKKSLVSISTYAQSQNHDSVELPPNKAPTPISPPSSPSQTTHDEKEKELPPPGSTLATPQPLIRSPASPGIRKAAPVWNGSSPQQPQLQQQQQASQQSEVQIPRTESKTEVKPGEVTITPSSTTTLTPSPRQDSLPSRSHSKQTARHALTPPASPASHVFASHVKDLRRLLANATNADECRLLVDMFLAQSGFPLSASDHVEPTNETLEQQQTSVVEALLSNGDAPTMSTKDSMSTLADANPPTPRSNSHSPTISQFRKQTHTSADALAMTHVVSAEA